jgi:hypothetical protein
MFSDLFAQKVDVPKKMPKRGLLRFVRKLTDDNISFKCQTLTQIITKQIQITRFCSSLA